MLHPGLSCHVRLKGPRLFTRLNGWTRSIGDFTKVRFGCVFGRAGLNVDGWAIWTVTSVRMTLILSSVGRVDNANFFKHYFITDELQSATRSHGYRPRLAGRTHSG